MTSDFTGFGFLQAAMQSPSDIRRGYGLGTDAPLDIRRGYGLGGDAPLDIRRGYGLGGVATPDTTQHGTSTFMALPQS